MVAWTARRKSLYVYHLHMDGPDTDALEWRALFAPRFARQLEHMGVAHVSSAAEADVVVVTGLLMTGNLDTVLVALAGLPSPSVVMAAGDAAINGGIWSRLGMPALARHPLSYYVDVSVPVPGDPPTPDDLIKGLQQAAEILGSGYQYPS
jgi:Ni,Fe-hydrogenase III small subunit